jgi:hypothetical protein
MAGKSIRNRTLIWISTKMPITLTKADVNIQDISGVMLPVAEKDWLNRKIDYYTQDWRAQPVGRRYVKAAEASLARV